MFIIIFILILSKLTLSAYTIKQTITNGASVNLKIAVSQSGAKMIAGNNNGSIIIYQMTAGQYVYSQEFNMAETIKSVYITGDETFIISGRLNSCQIYSYDAGTGLYTLYDNKVISGVAVAKMTENLIFLLVGSFNPGLIVYKNDGAGNYIFYQNLTDATNSWDLYLTPDNRYMITGGS